MKTQRTQQSCLLLALSEENPPVTGGFPSQKANNMGNVSLSWHHPVINRSRVSCQKGPTRWCLRMADRALLAGYPQDANFTTLSEKKQNTLAISDFQ